MTVSVLAEIRPMLWDVAQWIFGANRQKEEFYLSCVDPEGKSTGILDFGCATGNTAKAFEGYNYTGIDIDPNLIAFAKRKYERHGDLQFIAADIFEYQPEAMFDRILFAGVAHHLDDAMLPRILVRLRTMLRPAGHLVFIDPIRTGKESGLLDLLMKLDQGKFHRRYEDYAELFAQLEIKVLGTGHYQCEGTLFPQPEYAFFRLQ
jgi:SAM-dependent methyltransferase